MNRTEILREAERLISGDRARAYGSVKENYDLVAALWSAYTGTKITAQQALVMMALFKIARIKSGKAHADSYVDACGYLALVGEVALLHNDTDAVQREGKRPDGARVGG